MKVSHVFASIVIATTALLSCDATLSYSQTNPNVEVGFSPATPGETGCTERIVKRIGSANQSIYIQAYSFTSQDIGAALIKARRKNPKLTIQIILDRSNAKDKHSLMPTMMAHGIPVYLDSSHAENCIFIKDRAQAQKYFSNWQRHLEHSVLQQRD